MYLYVYVYVYTYIYIYIYIGGGAVQLAGVEHLLGHVGAPHELPAHVQLRDGRPPAIERSETVEG